MDQSLLLTFFFFFNDTATTEIYTLSLHDALPICIDAEGEQPVIPVACEGDTLGLLGLVLLHSLKPAEIGRAHV